MFTHNQVSNATLHNDNLYLVPNFVKDVDALIQRLPDSDPDRYSINNTLNATFAD